MALVIVLWPRPHIPGAPHLCGQVTDENGRGIARVQVWISGEHQNRWLAQETYTDANGNYEFKARSNKPEPASGLFVSIQPWHPNYKVARYDNWVRINFGSVLVKDGKITRDFKLIWNRPGGQPSIAKP